MKKNQILFGVLSLFILASSLSCKVQAEPEESIEPVVFDESPAEVLLEEEVETSVTDKPVLAIPPKPEKVLVHDFEGEDLTNALGGASGSWNLDPTDINESWCDEEIVEVAGKDGELSHALSLTYSLNPDKRSQNGFWTKLENFDAEYYDHLYFDIKGDAEEGFTDIMRLELKKCKSGNCTGDSKIDEVIIGRYNIPVTGEWTTIKIPLNRMTGIIDFADPAAWHNPSVARKNLDQLVFNFVDRQVSELYGKVYIDNIQFVHTDNPGPMAIDKPKLSREKTEERIEGLDFARFLIQRLGGFPEKLFVEKEFPEDDEAFIREVARDTWHFFEDIVDAEHGLPLDTIKLGQNEVLEEGSSWVGDYTNVTNIGVYLMCIVSAFDLGFIDQEEAVRLTNITLNTVENLDYHKPSGFLYNYYDTTLAEKTEWFTSLVDSGWLMAGLYVVKEAFEEVKPQAERILARQDLGFYYDPIERQFKHGFYEHLDVYSDYNYGAFYTEPRVTSYMAIARGEVPEDHWFVGLIRTFPADFAWQNQKPIHRELKTTHGHVHYGGWYEWKGIKFVPSWGGSAFEALMPTLVLKEKELSPEGLGRNNEAHVQGQIRFALEDAGQEVWGMSPSSDAHGGYSEFGAKPFGSKGYKAGVVTPHASVLTLEYAPKEAVANLRKLIELYPIYGEYGFYDAVDVKTGDVSRKYLALDQGMILVSINNYLNDGAIRKRFHSDPLMKQAEHLLSAEKFFEIPENAAQAAA